MPPAAKPHFIAFYSYKGGVGRTLALANCARALAADGKTVAIIDLDLEAPGLEVFDAFRPKGEAPVAQDAPRPPLAGFAEYIATCRKSGPPKELCAYFHRCVGLPEDKGSVYLMPAGQRDGEDYRAILAFDWDRFYRDEEGYRIMENLRGHIAHNLGSDEARPIRPDYVLIDSRTGLSETGGIATHQLADLVVLLFSLNRQNLEGTRWVHDSLAKLPNPPKMLLVASPIPEMPPGKKTPFHERMDYVRRHLKGALNAGQPLVITYRPLLSWEERIFVDDPDAIQFQYDRPYRALLERIREALGDLAPSVAITHLPAGTAHFLGREAELAALDAAWDTAGKTAIIELIAPGGTGKTALVKRWLDGMRQNDWRGARRVFAWSFYSQGTSSDRQAAEDHFLVAALEWFGVEVDACLGPWDKGRKLAEAVATQRSLLILDGIEPLQYPPGPLAGELRAPGLKALLTHLAAAGQPGLCVLSSRAWIQDIAEWVGGTVQRFDLGNLADADGARLLHALGAKRAGAVEIDSTDAELQQASHEVCGHALSLSLLGRYLALAFDGDIRKRDQVDFRTADAETAKGHAFRGMAAYETWFTRQGADGARELAALRLLGFFDRPASAASLAALRAAPAIEGLTEALTELSPAQWRGTLKRLQDAGLIDPMEADVSLDAHPLVREYLAAALKERQPDAWREGHRRIYEQLKASAPRRPDGLAGLQPLYQAVAHGCLAGLWQEACDEVYVERILRGTGDDGFYSWKKLGAFGANLGAMACFFVEPWRRLAPELTEADQAWLLNETAMQLRALGRLEEALEPMRTGAEMAMKQENWRAAAIRYGNLGEPQLSLGRLAAAVADARHAVDHADRSGDAFLRMVSRATLANALHQQGAAALEHFVAAEALQAQSQPQYPLLYSLHGFQYCDLLLAAAERAAWLGSGEAALALRCAEVAERAAQTLPIAERNNWLLDIALNHLSLARCALYADRLRGHPPGATAQIETDRAVFGLRAAGTMDHLPRGLLTRAWLRHCLNDPVGAAADLTEAHSIAARGGMRLHLADIALTRARLFQDRDQLAEARRLIEECGYGRRLGELEDAEATLTPANGGVRTPE